MTLAIDVHGLNKSFGDKHVVNDVTIQVAEGRICGFLGPNGSGKTTTLRMLCGLLTPDSGSGQALGYDIIAQADEVKLRTGYMTQRFSLYEDLTIAENLEFTARVYGLDRRRERVDRALERLGLASRRGQLAGTLSGGWKQRLALATATLHEPRLLLLDEPTAGVDPKARRDFWEHIHTLADKGLSVLVSTHYMDEAERCHRLAYIAYGKLLVTGTASEVIASQKLVTFAVSGEDVHALTEGLRSSPAVSQVTPFGNVLHVTGRDESELARAIAAAAPGERYRVEKIETTLEDVFINLMGGTQDNFQ